MIRPDFRDFISHSAKGSEWEKHKYVKKLDGNYYYPDGYEGGRTISSLKDKSEDKKEKKEDSDDWEKKFHEGMAKALKDDPELKGGDITRYDFGAALFKFAGINEKDLSKEEIDKIQKRMVEYYDKGGKVDPSEDDDLKKKLNELAKKATIEKKSSKPSGTTSKKEEGSSEESEKKEEKKTSAASKAITAVNNKPIDMSKIYSVYDEQKKRKKKK